MTLALTGCSWCYDNGFVLKLDEIGVGAGSCSNASVHFRRRLRCKPSRLKRAGELYEISSEWTLLALGNGFVFKRLCSLQKAPEMQTEQAEKSRRTL